MPPSAPEKSHLVEEIVHALTGAPEVEDASGSLGQQMQRATREVDERTADAFAKALLDSLCEDPGNVRQLEALIVLGLAHPDALSRRGISVGTEGRRLAVMLEQAGESERAACLIELLVAHTQTTDPAEEGLEDLLQQSGDGEKLVEEYMDRAQVCARKGKTQEAISWLQEVLLIDRSRRDVARMIRDLRYKDADRKVRRRKIGRGLFYVLLLVGGVGSVALRELSLHKKWNELPNAGPVQLPEVRARLAAVEGMIQDHRLWIGLPEALGERDELRGRLEEARLEDERQERQLELEHENSVRMADAARLRGLMNVELGNFEEAVEDFRRGLSLVGEDWEHRERVETDLQAIEEMLEAAQ